MNQIELSPFLYRSREDTLRRCFIEDVRGDDEKLARSLRIVERELKAGGRN